MIRHHPSAATLAAYAAGTLVDALALVTATHLGRCATCQEALATLEATGGALLEELAPVAVSDGALERVLARLGEPAPAKPPVLNPELPQPLDRAALGRWWPVGIGVRYRPFRTVGSAWGGLLLAQSGRSLPPHDHIGLELTCVLSGRFVDGAGLHEAGDLSEPLGNHDQPPVVTGSEPCLCVIASEGMRLRGLPGRLQRLIGW